MRLIANIANRLRNIIEKKDEVQEPSGGFFPYRVRQKAASFVTDTGRLLDIGAGEGLLPKILGQKPSKRVYCVDIEREKLEQAADRLPNSKKIQLIVGDGRYLPFRSECFNEVTLLNLFLNIPDSAVVSSLLHEALRVCRIDGRVMFDYRNSMNPLILLSYKTVSFHDPELTLPLRAFARGEIRDIVDSIGMRKSVAYHPIPSWWKVNPPAYLVEIRKRA